MVNKVKSPNSWWSNRLTCKAEIPRVFAKSTILNLCLIMAVSIVFPSTARNWFSLAAAQANGFKSQDELAVGMRYKF